MSRIYKVPFATTSDDSETLAATEQPDGKVSLPTGWTSVYELENDNPSYKPIGRGEMNGLFNEITAGIGELQLQGGVITWRAIDGGFNKGAIVYGADMQTMWQSTVDSNTTDPDSAGASGWLTPLQAQMIDLIDAPMIGKLSFAASIDEGDGWLRLPEKSTSANATLSRTDYAKLFAKIGTTYGAGDGSTTFALPTILDSTGQFSCFLRPMLASGTIGAKHGDTIRDIKGNVASLRFGTIADFIEDGPFYKEDGENYGGVQTVAPTSNRHNIKFDVSRVMATGPENTPNYAEYPVFIFVGRNPA